MNLDIPSHARAATSFAILVSLIAPAAHAQDRGVRGAVGLGVSYGPTFLGSDEQESNLIPILDLEIGRYGFLNQRGLGLQNSNKFGSGDLKYGFGLGYDFEERIAADEPNLNGLPDIEAGAIATLFVEYETGPLTYGVELQHGLSDEGSDGTQVKLFGTYSAQVNNRMRLSATPYFIWADDSWMDTYFSVTPTQSVASGLATFDANSGVAQGGIVLTGSYALRPRTILFTSLDVSTLTGDAKDSSVSLEDTQTSLTAGVLFRF
ncbi:MipA/OmpV family protein [Epibacterium sp. SM1979]|uniref:MipA/OmpV family protein n=1 Tax=Tritonibacter litoralis TaxID=2662264 RepID=A0A843YBY3_9RHOB|nr:MipA/OmpV family protein [Tritonibacter litoralis]MQQ08471.1 MipA/OmpV family protein [Tritonibacter litoralis]